MDEHENEIKSALTGFGESPVRAYFARWVFAQNPILDRSKMDILSRLDRWGSECEADGFSGIKEINKSSCPHFFQ